MEYGKDFGEKYKIGVKRENNELNFFHVKAIASDSATLLDFSKPGVSLIVQ
jgi:hypothetical protein